MGRATAHPAIAEQPVSAATTDGVQRPLLAVALFLHAVVHASFAAWIVLRQPGWTHVFHTGTNYAFADGSLGLIVFALVLPFATRGSPRLLATLTLVDAIGRLAVGFTLREFPGLPIFPVTFVSFFGVVGGCAAALGLIAMTAWAIARARAGRTWSADSDALFDPLAAVAIVSFVIGYVLFVDPPATGAALRILAACGSGALAVVFSVASIGALAHRAAAP